MEQILVQQSRHEALIAALKAGKTVEIVHHGKVLGIAGPMSSLRFHRTSAGKTSVGKGGATPKPDAATKRTSPAETRAAADDKQKEAAMSAFFGMHKDLSIATTHDELRAIRRGRFSRHDAL